MKLVLKDTTLTGDILNQITIAVENERTTVKELIAARVTSEVTSFNEKQPEVFKGLIQPSETEKILNGFRLKKKKKIDVEQQILIAYDAFQKNGYFILIDDEQATELEQEVLISKDTSVHFIKLTPLIGG